MIDWPQFVRTIHAAQRILLVSHIRPDCDALGSELGMAGVLDALGKDVRIVNGQATPPSLTFIDPRQRIEAIGAPVTAAELHDRDLVIILDTSAWVQLGPMAEVIQSLPAQRIVLDHHVSTDELGATLFKDTTAEATGRLVLEASEHLQVALTPEIATPLFAAIATDTGWFRFGSASAICYQSAAKLIAAGASPAGIYRELFERETLGRLLLRGAILSHVQLELNGRLAHTYVTNDDFARTGALHSDTEDVVNQLFGVAGTEVAVILVEQPAGGFKISFRSRSTVDCSQLASGFRGGGHKAAAGGSITGSLASAQQVVLDAVRAAMQ
ncbi:MAG: DHH family phosphoesterase [Planctomycetota bacterium]